MPLCPTKGGAVRSFCDSRSKFFRGCQYTQSSDLHEVLRMREDIARGEGRWRFFQCHRKARSSRQRAPSPSESCLRKGRLRTRCPSASKPGRAPARRRRRGFYPRRLWVIRVVSAMSAVSPLYPHELTSSARPTTSEECQQATFSPRDAIVTIVRDRSQALYARWRYPPH